MLTTNNMRIGIDLCCWANRRGFGRFTRELVNALIEIDERNDYLCFVDQQTASSNEFPDKMNIVVASTDIPPTQAASASGHRSLRDLWALSRQVMKYDLDIFFFPAVYSYFPLLNRAKKIVTLHDVIADHHPDKVFPSKKLMLLWKAKQYLAIQQADLILTVSEYSKKQISQYHKMPESRVQVIPEGPSQVFSALPRNQGMLQALRRYHLKSDGRFLLYVGGISPHKNLKALIAAYHRLTKESGFSDVKLVLVGDYEKDSFYSDYPSLKSYVEDLFLDGRVIFTGFIEDSELAYLYNAASALVFPSLEEGFGLPAVEAMTCGTPVVSSDRGSLPEIVGNAGRFFDPHNPEMMFKVIKEVISDDNLSDQMKQRGFAQSKKFTWETAAKKLISVFKDLAGESVKNG